VTWKGGHSAPKDNPVVTTDPGLGARLHRLAWQLARSDVGVARSALPGQPVGGGFLRTEVGSGVKEDRRQHRKCMFTQRTCGELAGAVCEPNSAFSSPCIRHDNCLNLQTSLNRAFKGKIGLRSQLKTPDGGEP
jgi:hypothetical protein